jgi:hypothetical protein
LLSYSSNNMNILSRINRAIGEFEPTINLLYRIGIILAIFFGLTYIGDSLDIPGDPQSDVSCEAPRISG